MTLRDLLKVINCDIKIMHSCWAILKMSSKYISEPELYLSDSLLNSKVRAIENGNSDINIWLEEE